MQTSLPTHESPAPPSLADAAQADDMDFRPAPLGWLMSWFMDRKRPKPVAEPEPFDEHINGLA
ncbi:hypothetical protein [Viridibacterium curvum]|uniref:Uncharacterized protein n=1 Tax=Viridibacterium curvum TaxID=1101404 RepID=A0ABP9QT74_9RHOO